MTKMYIFDARSHFQKMDGNRRKSSLKFFEKCKVDFRSQPVYATQTTLKCTPYLLYSFQKI